MGQLTRLAVVGSFCCLSSLSCTDTQAGSDLPELIWAQHSRSYSSPDEQLTPTPVRIEVTSAGFMCVFAGSGSLEQPVVPLSVTPDVIEVVAENSFSWSGNGQTVTDGQSAEITVFDDTYNEVDVEARENAVRETMDRCAEVGVNGEPYIGFFNPK